MHLAGLTFIAAVAAETSNILKKKKKIRKEAAFFFSVPSFLDLQFYDFAGEYWWVLGREQREERAQHSLCLHEMIEKMKRKESIV